MLGDPPQYKVNFPLGEEWSLCGGGGAAPGSDSLEDGVMRGLAAWTPTRFRRCHNTACAQQTGTVTMARRSCLI